MIIYLCIKFQSNATILSKDIARKPFVLCTGQTYVRTAVILYAPPNRTPPPPIENEKNVAYIWPDDLVFFTIYDQVSNLNNLEMKTTNVLIKFHDVQVKNVLLRMFIWFSYDLT